MLGRSSARLGNSSGKVVVPGAGDLSGVGTGVGVGWCGVGVPGLMSAMMKEFILVM